MAKKLNNQNLDHLIGKLRAERIERDFYDDTEEEEELSVSSPVARALPLSGTQEVPNTNSATMTPSTATTSPRIQVSVLLVPRHFHLVKHRRYQTPTLQP